MSSSPKRHPFEGDPQYQQIYGNRQGKRLGTPGNGIGSVKSGFGSDGSSRELRSTRQGRARPTKVFEENDGSVGFWRNDIQTAEDEALTAMEPQSEPLVDYDALRERIRERLTPKQRYVMELKLGIRDGLRIERGDEFYRPLWEAVNEPGRDLPECFGYTLEEIAGFMGVSVATVHEHYEAGLRRLRSVFDPRTCVVCGEPLEGSRSNRRTCSDRCRARLARKGRVTVTP